VLPLLSPLVGEGVILCLALLASIAYVSFHSQLILATNSHAEKRRKIITGAFSPNRVCFMAWRGHLGYIYLIPKSYTSHDMEKKKFNPEPILHQIALFKQACKVL
jgi:hypothetical protein